MHRAHAEQIATLLNARNQLVTHYDADRVLQASGNYLYEVSDAGEVAGCVELKRVQWSQWEVSHLTTAQSAEGKGVAVRLLQRAEDRAKFSGCLILQCTIRQNNDRSQARFKKSGFNRVAEFFYPASGNKVGVWQKTISPVTGTGREVAQSVKDS